MKGMISVLFTLLLVTGLFAAKPDSWIPISNPSSDEEEEIEVTCKVENNKCVIVIIKDGEEKRITVSLDDIDILEDLDILDDFAEDMDEEDFDIKKDIDIRHWFGHDEDDGNTWLGVIIQSLTETEREHLKVRGSEGVLISKVVPGSPADKAELKAGDVILSVGREEIEDLDDLVEIIQEEEPGDEVTIRIVRDGRRKTVRVTLDSREVGPSKRRSLFSHGSDPDKGFTHPFKFKHVLPGCHRELESLKEELGELREELDQLKKELKASNNP